ncbi:MAG: hypothetical protein WBG48_10635 [Pricia sp.]
MHDIFKSVLNVCLLAVAMTFAACQNDVPFEADIDAERTLTATSAIIDMMKRTTSNDGSYDNIVDGASCIAIQFPYSVVVNGSELLIASMEDLENIEKILDAAEIEEAYTSVDEPQQSISIIFPVTVRLSDQTDIVVDSQAVLEDHAKQCIEGGDDADIECIDMSYPIELFTYNPDLQQTGSVVVGHDQEFRRFLAGLTESDLISIDFPLTFRLHDSTEITVNSNAALADALQSAMDGCDEDDDNDYNDDDFTKESLDSLLVTCPWSVRKLEAVVVDSVVQVQEDILTFLEGGTLVSNNGAMPAQEGKWSVAVSDNAVFVTLNVEDAFDYNGKRYTYRIGEDTLKMHSDESGEIVLERLCGYQN